MKIKATTDAQKAQKNQLPEPLLPDDSGSEDPSVTLKKEFQHAMATFAGLTGNGLDLGIFATDRLTPQLKRPPLEPSAPVESVPTKSVSQEQPQTAVRSESERAPQTEGVEDEERQNEPQSTEDPTVPSTEVVSVAAATVAPTAPAGAQQPTESAPQTYDGDDGATEPLPLATPQEGEAASEQQSTVLEQLSGVTPAEVQPLHGESAPERAPLTPSVPAEIAATSKEAATTVESAISQPTSGELPGSQEILIGPKQGRMSGESSGEDHAAATGQPQGLEIKEAIANVLDAFSSQPFGSAGKPELKSPASQILSAVAAVKAAEQSSLARNSSAAATSSTTSTTLPVQATRDGAATSETGARVSVKILPRPMALKMMSRVESALEEVAKSKDGKSLSFRLDPPDLGTVKVEVSIRHGNLNARIVAESPQVSLLLREHAHELQSTLRKLGLNVDTVQVSIQSHGEGSFGQEMNRGGEQSLHQQKQPGMILAKPWETEAATPKTAVINDHWVA